MHTFQLLLQEAFFFGFSVTHETDSPGQGRVVAYCAFVRWQSVKHETITVVVIVIVDTFLPLLTANCIRVRGSERWFSRVPRAARLLLVVI